MTLRLVSHAALMCPIINRLLCVEYQSIPLSKIEDFGVHCKQYYPLEVSYFKSSLDTQLLDLLWNKYWVNTLSSSPLLAVCLSKPSQHVFNL